MQPQTDLEYASFACVSSLQRNTRIKASDFDVVKEEVMNTIKVKEIRTSNDVVILKAQSNSSRNLLIRAAVYKIVNKSLVYPAQALKSITIKINLAKKVKIGSAHVMPKSRMNPDSSSGLAGNAELEAKARQIQKNKAKAEAEKEKK